ncbi:MAG: FtsX-like permease family protein [Pseudanabaenaceae cyanobacterium]
MPLRMFAVPLAWRQLTHQKSRLAVAIAGITFAIILIFMQIGFQDALFRSAVRLQTNIQADVVAISPQSTNLVGMRNFSQRRALQALGFPEVAAVKRIYLALTAWKIDENPAGQTRNILVLGADPNASVFLMPGIRENLPLTQEQDAVLFDRTSRAEFGPIFAQGVCGPTVPPACQARVAALLQQTTPESFAANHDVIREVGGRQVRVRGFFELGSSFAADGAIVTSELNFLRIFDQRRPGLINIAAIDLQPGLPAAARYEFIYRWAMAQPGDRVFLPARKLPADGRRVQKVPGDAARVMVRKADLTVDDLRRTEDVTADDLRILTQGGFIEFERSYWQNSTAIGFIFTLGTVMGFIVGVVVVYQILYTDVSDHMAEYATLKAMGYSNLFLSWVVIQEALVLAVLGYIPGFGVGWFLYNLTRNATRLPLAMTLERGLQVFALTVLMCAISGAISLRKVQSADPAEMFT